VTCIPLRLALPLVARKNLSADHREALGKAGIHPTKWALPAQGEFEGRLPRPVGWDSFIRYA
jgi:hypothetical protein